MKKLLFNNLLLFILVAVLSSCHSGHESSAAGSAGKISGTGTVSHDTINKKVEIRNPGLDQQKTDSIKDAKTRGKKLASASSVG